MLDLRSPSRLLCPAILAALLLPAAGAAPTPIATVTTSLVDLADQTRSGLDSPSIPGAPGDVGFTGFSTLYNGLELRIDSFTAGSLSYTPLIQGAAFGRRNTATPNFPLVNGPLTGQWNATVGTPGSASVGQMREVNGRYFNTMEALFTSQNLYTGTENLFVNDDTQGPNPGNGTNIVSNIERMDFIFGTGVMVTSDLSFAVFERGSGAIGGSGTNGGFRVAVITGLDVSGVPNAFADVIQSVTDNAYGLTNLVEVRYDVYRNETIASTDLGFLNNEDIGPQGIAGAVFRVSEFTSVGSTVYGYAVFGEDVTAANGAQLINWDDPAFFPPLSPFTNDTDMVATGAYFFVPEPAASAPALALAAGLAALPRRRPRR